VFFFLLLLCVGAKKLKELDKQEKEKEKEAKKVNQCCVGGVS
jgi:hypothetical protein